MIELRNWDNFKFDDDEILAFSVASGTVGFVFDELVFLLNSDALIGNVSDEKLPSDCWARKLDLNDEKEILPEL